MDKIKNTFINIYTWFKNLNTETKMRIIAGGLMLGGTILSLTAGDDNETIDITDDAIVSEEPDDSVEFVPSTIE